MMLEKLVTRPRSFLSVTLAIFFLMHLYQITAPPNGYHQWRESDTAAVSLNYYQEDANPLHPRINQRGAGSGITGMELPVYNYTVVASYFLFGPSHTLARLITVLAGCVGILLLYGIALRLTDSTTSLMIAWAGAFAPVFFFYSYKIMPDIFMLMFWLMAIYLFLRYHESGMMKYLIGSGLTLTISACIKPLGLCVLLPFLYLTLRSTNRNAASNLRFSAYTLISVACVLGWFWYARSVNLEHGNAGFYLGENLSNLDKFLFTKRFFKRIFLQWPFELWTGWVLVPAFAVGIYKLLKAPGRSFLILWGLSILIIFGLTAQHSSTHDYYTLVAVPLTAIVTGFGLKFFYDGHRWSRIALTTFLLLAPVGAFVGMEFRFGDASTFGEFDEIRLAASNHIEPSSLVLVQDATPAIRLYQLNRTGWPLRREITYAVVEPLIRQGGEYLILDHPVETYPDSLANLVRQPLFRIGPLYGYKVKPRR